MERGNTEKSPLRGGTAASLPLVLSKRAKKSRRRVAVFAERKIEGWCEAKCVCHSSLSRCWMPRWAILNTSCRAV